MSDTLMTRRAPPLPLPLSAPKASTVVLVLTGIAGIGVAVAAGSAGFLQLYVQKAVVNFDWELCLQASMLFAFVGGVLCLAQQQIGVPLVIGASSTMVATVATTLASPSLSVSRMLDAVPIRGALLLAGGAAGVVGIGVGIAGLRGRRSLGFVIPVVALVMATLVATAAFFRIDDDPNGSSVRPFLGFAFIAVVGVVCSFGHWFGHDRHHVHTSAGRTLPRARSAVAVGDRDDRVDRGGRDRRCLGGGTEVRRARLRIGLGVSWGRRNRCRVDPARADQVCALGHRWRPGVEQSERNGSVGCGSLRSVSAALLGRCELDRKRANQRRRYICRSRVTVDA